MAPWNPGALRGSGQAQHATRHGRIRTKKEESHETSCCIAVRGGLTPEQQARVDSIQTYYRQQMPSFTSGSPPDSATRENVRGLFRREVEDIRAVLTADQQKAFDKNLAQLRRGRRGGP